MGNLIRLVIVLFALVVVDSAKHTGKWAIEKVAPLPPKPCKKWHHEPYAKIGKTTIDQKT